MEDTEEFFYSQYVHSKTHIYNQKPKVVETTLRFETRKRPSKTGLLLVGLGGNNGSTLYASLVAHKNNIQWNTKEGIQEPSFLGSLTQSSSIYIGLDEQNNEVFLPIKEVVPLVDPLDLLIDGWDINNDDMADAMVKAKVLPYDLQRQLYPILKEERKIPKPSIYKQEFIASNQSTRANNIIDRHSDLDLFKAIRHDIHNFKTLNELEKVIVLWTANTEKGTDEISTNPLTIDEYINNHDHLPPSKLFALASIAEGCPFINGSPQNTITKDILQLASYYNVPIVGNDFKSGQTKMKSALIDWLLGAGIKPRCIASYNHLGNNDGKNLNEEAQFRSKELSKLNVIQDMISTNSFLYKEGEDVDHCIVIKYLPYVGDSKRAMDEYTSEIFMGGENTITIHNVCEDSLLASPLILDLTLLMELFTRINTRTIHNKKQISIQHLLSYFFKNPVTTNNLPIVNSLYRQRNGIENLFRIIRGWPVDNNIFFI